MSHSTGPAYDARRGGPVVPFRGPCAVLHAFATARVRACVYDAIMRARYFPATTAKLPAIDNYANYAIKLFIQAVPDPRREERRSRLRKTP